MRKTRLYGITGKTIVLCCFKDFTGGFTKGKPGLAIMYAEMVYIWGTS